MTSSCSANFDPIWTKLGWIGAVIMPVTWTQSQRLLDWSVVVVLDKYGRVVVLVDGGRPAVVNHNLEDERWGFARGARRTSVVLV